MANTTETLTYFSGERKASVRVIFLSDGSTTTATQVVDISGLQGAPTKVTILEARATVTKIDRLSLNFDHTTDDEGLIFPTGYTEFLAERGGGLTDPSSAGETGDLVVAATGPAANGSAIIDLLLLLHD